MSEFTPDEQRGQVPDDASELFENPGTDGVGTSPEVRVSELEQLVGERTADLQRLQAEYVNYKKRVDRDRQVSRQSGVEQVVTELLPVLDSIAMADQHGELSGGFKMVADELAKIAAKHGLHAFGAVGDPFDPHLHEALMQVPLPGATEHCVSQVMQQGFTMHDRVLRPARVAVSDPDPAAAAAEPTENQN